MMQQKPRPSMMQMSLQRKLIVKSMKATRKFLIYKLKNQIHVGDLLFITLKITLAVLLQRAALPHQNS